MTAHPLDPKLLHAMQDECVDCIEAAAKQLEAENAWREKQLVSMERSLIWLIREESRTGPAAYEVVAELLRQTRALHRSCQTTTGGTGRKDRTES